MKAREGDDRGWDGWMISLTINEHEFEQTPGDSEGQGSLACCSPWSLRIRHDLVTEHSIFIYAFIDVKLFNSLVSSTYLFIF